jgi:tetratricopeptide (TPR) repeat protein
MRVLIFTLLGSSAFALQLTSEEPLSDAQKSILAEGISFHDQRKYDEAIGRYRDLLSQNPNNATAWYELAFSQSAGRYWADCVASAQKGLTIESKLRSALLMSMANCQDESGNSAAALETYQNALASLPPNANPSQKALIHFNIAIAYRAQGDVARAKEQLQTAIGLNPAHASSHLKLVEIYLSTGDRIPALLALGVFLCLEPPDSPRVRDAMAQVREILTAGVKQTGPNTININVPETAANNPEGDFGPELMMIGLLGATDMIKPSNGAGKQRPQSGEFEQLESRWSTLIETMLRKDSDRDLSKTFSARTYFPFYRGLKERRLVPTFAHHIFQTAGFPSTPTQNKAEDRSPELNEWVGAWLKRGKP